MAVLTYAIIGLPIFAAEAGWTIALGDRDDIAQKA